MNIIFIEIKNGKKARIFGNSLVALRNVKTVVIPKGTKGTNIKSHRAHSLQLLFVSDCGYPREQAYALMVRPCS